MGLDIIAYRGLMTAPQAMLDADDKAKARGLANGHGWGECCIRIDEDEIAWIEERWPGRSAGVPSGRYDCANAHHFRAGSYSSYSTWRDDLARLAGYGSAESFWQQPQEGPFAELINFSDCEGIIGPVVSAKLAKDFADNEDKAVKFADEATDKYWLNLYRDWKTAFELAADNGAVCFR